MILLQDNILFLVDRLDDRWSRLATNFLDPRYRELGNLGLISPAGDLDNRGIQDISAALRRPHGENVRRKNVYYRRQQERRNGHHESNGYSSDEPPRGFTSQRRSISARCCRSISPPTRRSASPLRRNPTRRRSNSSYRQDEKRRRVDHDDKHLIADAISTASTLFPNEFMTFPQPITLSPTDLTHTPLPMISGPVLPPTPASLASPIESGPGPTTMLNQQAINNQHPSSSFSSLAMNGNARPSSPISEFLNMDGDAPMDDDDHRDDFLRDFENI
ncbi:hypothetical protein H0H92_010567 [Tricholoma furcatifolium]|nr:hypothetical protein H0H92_010567 [Tricholoma furcatifolium]